MIGRSARTLAWLAIAALLTAAVAWLLITSSGRSQDTTGSNTPRWSLGQMLADSPDSAGFARAESVRAFNFPRDHGPHPAFRSEWWYFTGNLADPTGRRFGYELTFFRLGLAAGPVKRESAWASHQAWMAHLAITNVADKHFLAFERFERGALGLAGARAEPFAVWLDDWSVRGKSDPSCRGCLTATITAGNDQAAIDLDLHSRKPVVLQGDHGLSRKSAAAGNASYYYSLTRLASQGRVRVGDRSFTIAGDSWLDREWSTSALDKDVAGWDWFSLQLDDGHDLMYYQLRRRDGRPDPFSAGRLVDADGSSLPLAADAVTISVLDHWRSPHSGTEYPSGWRLQIPDQAIDLTITPLLRDQELDLAFRYWEGACQVEGHADGKPVNGHAYVELTGYGTEPPPR